MVRVVYNHINSGGSDWLAQQDWQTLLENGWNIRDGKASKHFKYLDQGIREWATILNMDPDVEGCPCCGRPHEFWDQEAGSEW